MAGGMGSLVSKLLAKDEAATQNQQPDGLSLSSGGNSLFTGMPVPQAAFTIQPPGASTSAEHQNSQPLPNLAQEALQTSADQSDSLSLDLDLGDTAPDTASTSKQGSLQLSDNDASHLYPSGESTNPPTQQPITEENFFIAEHPQPQPQVNEAGDDDNNLSIAIADDDFTLNSPLGSPISMPLEQDTATQSAGEEPLPIVDLSTGDIVDLSLGDDSASDTPPLSLEPVTEDAPFELTPLPLDEGNETDDMSLPFLSDEQEHNLDFSISIDSDDTLQPESQWGAESVELDFSDDASINTTNDDWLSNPATDENQTTDDWLGSTTDTPSSTHQQEDTEDDWLGDTSEPAPLIGGEINAEPQNLNPSIEIAPDLFDDEVNEAPIELELNPGQSLEDDTFSTEEDTPDWLNADATSPNEVALSDNNLQEPHLEITPATDMMTPQDGVLPSAEIASYPTIEPLIISSEDVAQYYPEDDELADVGQPVSSIMLPDSDDESVFDEFDNTTQLNVASTSQSTPSPNLSLRHAGSETAGSHSLPDSPLALLEPFDCDDDWNLSLPNDIATPRPSATTTADLNGDDDFNIGSNDNNLDGFSDSFSLTLPDDFASQSTDLPSKPIETSKTRPDMLDLPVWLTSAEDTTASLEGNNANNRVTPQPDINIIESEQDALEFPSLGFDDEDAVDLFDGDELISKMADEQADTETALPATSSPIAAAHEPQPETIETATTHENILFKKQLTDTLMVRVVSQPDGVVALIAHDDRHQTPKTLRQLPKGMVPKDAIITAGKDMRLRSCTIYRIEIGHWTGLFGQDDASGALSFRDEILMD